MADETKTGDAGQSTNASNSSTENKTVTYEEFSKLKADFETRTREFTSLKEENEKLRDTLLSDDYLKKLAGEGDAAAPKQDSAQTDLESMSKKELVEFTVRTIAQQLGPKLEERFRNLESSIQISEAKKELDEARRTLPSFKEYEPKVREKIERNGALTYRDAYLIVRQEENLAKDEETKQREAKSHSEKPGGIYRSVTTNAEFKSKAEANEDAWNRTVGKTDKL